MERLPTLSGALLAAALTLPAQAGRPLATEDADTLEAGACEWESLAGRETARSAAAVRTWATQVGCGIGHRAQFALGYGRTSSDGFSVPVWSLGGKLGLVERDGATAGITLAWALDAQKAPGASLRHESTLLNLVATKELADGILGHLNLGWTRSQSARQSATVWNAALEGEIGAGVDLMAEIYGDDRTRPWFGTGLRWTLSDGLSVNASYAVQMESVRVKLWAVGVKLDF